MAKSTGTVPVLACSRGFCALGLWLRKPTTTPHQSTRYTGWQQLVVTLVERKVVWEQEIKGKMVWENGEVYSRRSNHPERRFRAER
jgi:hypothetical protein